ncbi:MAG TPA: hypothetical protein VNE67_04305, partial [Acetobacteraceae bacterium]|nr:hypothetical protein [Acetobacteraceae bacterium]
MALTMPTACFCTRFSDGGPVGLTRWHERRDLSRMSRDDASDFRLRPGRIRDRGGPNARRSQSFVAQVVKAAAKANGGRLTHAQITGSKRRGGAPGKRRCSRIGRGQAVADRPKRQAAERSPGQRQRRVVVKARIVRHRVGSGAAGASPRLRVSGPRSHPPSSAPSRTSRANGYGGQTVAVAVIICARSPNES